jgi:hypothetical protein
MATGIVWTVFVICTEAAAALTVHGVVEQQHASTAFCKHQAQAACLQHHCQAVSAHALPTRGRDTNEWQRQLQLWFRNLEEAGIEH